MILLQTNHTKYRKSACPKSDIYKDKLSVKIFKDKNARTY